MDVLKLVRVLQVGNVLLDYLSVFLLYEMAHLLVVLHDLAEVVFAPCGVHLLEVVSFDSTAFVNSLAEEGSS